MTTRPADLPDFQSPPVTEVVLGVQFNSVERFFSPHLGRVWEKFKSDFPHIEEHPVIQPSFETFGPHPQMQAIGLQLVTTAEMPRVFFVNNDRTQLLQVQKDRFLHNWRKVEAGAGYPRFERMLETFESGFLTFVDVVAAENLGSVTPNQCEVTYINQITVPENGNVYAVIEQLFSQHTEKLVLGDLGPPEDFRFLLRYVIRDESNTPAGRLLVSAEPARRADGTTIVQLTLTARGKPSTSDIGGVVKFLERGRLHMVHAFADLTSPAMHRQWERTI